ncbi:MAG: hypothetical protein E4H01_09850 [Lysobacterales bacterium]|nr:MAG: hypothetical protein E4H01_09850 [Xanthomonadales bacterium]
MRATADAVYSPFRGIESGFASLAGNERRSSPSATLAEATGTIYVPADRWTDPNGEKFAQLDTAGRAKAREENQAIIREYHDRGKASDGMTLGTHEGRLLAGSKLAMKDAENADRRAVEIFSDFINPAVAGTLETMALDDPIAATQLYMEHRATGMCAAPEIMVDVDRRMLAVVQDAADQLGLEAMEHAGTTKGRVSQARLTRLQASTNVVAKQQPSVAADANIKDGLKVGDAQRAEDVLAAITDPDRPVAQHTDGAVKAAATMVGRINPQKRINDRQIQGLATLVEAGYLNGQTAMSVMLTGQWPQNAVTIDNLRDFDGEIWATYSNGTVGMIRGPKKDAGGKVPNREITEKHLNMMETGAATVFGELDESQTNRMRGLALHNPGWLRQHYNLESPEQLMQAGRLFAQTIVLSTRELKKRQEGWFQGSEKESPTEEQIFLSEEMRNKLAAEHGVQLVPMPALKKNHGLDLELVRSNMREGDYGPELVARSQELTDEEVAYEWYVRNATPEQIAAAKQAQQE